MRPTARRDDADRVDCIEWNWKNTSCDAKKDDTLSQANVAVKTLLALVGEECHKSERIIFNISKGRHKESRAARSWRWCLRTVYNILDISAGEFLCKSKRGKQVVSVSRNFPFGEVTCALPGRLQSAKPKWESAQRLNPNRRQPLLIFRCLNSLTIRRPSFFCDPCLSLTLRQLSHSMAGKQRPLQLHIAKFFFSQFSQAFNPIINKKCLGTIRVIR